MTSRKRGNEESALDESSGDFSSKRARNPDGQAVNTSAGRGSYEHAAASSAPRSAPGLVLHVRALPSFTTEAELESLLAPFARGSEPAVTRAFVTQHNHQAFVQMSSLEAAEAVVRASANPPGFMLRGRQIFMQYSNRKEVVAPPPNMHASAAAGGTGPSYTAPGHGGAHGHDSSAPNSIILISVTDLRVPVTLEHIHQICKASGNVLRIVTFMKGPVFKALVQFASIDQATAARAALEGKDIFQGCCHVSVSFSSVSELKISAPGPKARDFEAEAAGAPAPYSGGGGGGQQQQQQQQQAQHQQQAAFAQQMAAQQMGFPAGAAAGFPAGMNPFAAAMQQNPYAHMAGQMGFPGFPGMPGFPGADPSQQQQQRTQAGGGAIVGPIGGPGSVLLVSGLPQTPDITPESLFTLFGVYGDVIRVKILFAKRDTALVQFRDADGCRAAIQHLHHAPLAGEGAKPLNVSASKHSDISMPKTAADGADGGGGSSEGDKLTADFLHSKIHRYRNKPPNPKNLHPPSQVLHVANIADGVTEEALAQAFGPSSIAQLFKTDAHMAYVLLPSVSDAMHALMRMHNHKLHGRYIRVSFSAKDSENFQGTHASGGTAGGEAAAAGQPSAFAPPFDGQPKEEQAEDGMEQEL